MFKAALLHAEHARCAQWVIERVSLSFVGGQSGQIPQTLLKVQGGSGPARNQRRAPAVTEGRAPSAVVAPVVSCAAQAPPLSCRSAKGRKGRCLCSAAASSSSW